MHQLTKTERSALYDTLKRSLSLLSVPCLEIEPMAQVVWLGLQSFPRDVAVRTINAIETSSFSEPPRAGQILDIAKDFHGVPHDHLFWLGRNKFKKLAGLLHDDCDLVCDDWRASFALR